MKNIREQNIFWFEKDFKFREDSFVKRNLYFEIEKNLNREYILIISGLRRLGKTTIIRQIINKLLSKNTKNNNIFYYTFSKIDNSLEKYLDWYLKDYLNTKFRSEKIYIFLDELQYVESWQDIIKSWYDLYPNIHFIISGSTSLWLNKDKESLLGRFINFSIRGLSFEEFINFKFKKNLEKVYLSDSYEIIDKKYADKKIFLDLLDEYLTKGEFPGLINEDISFANSFIKESVIKVIFEKDIFVFDENINSSLAFSIYKILINNSGSLLSKSNISHKAGISKYILEKNLNILKKSFLIELLPNFLQSTISQEKSYKKSFCTSSNLIISGLGFKNFDDIVFENFKGHIIENFIYNKLSLIYDEIYYYNKSGNEVDFVVIEGQNKYPIEVKYKNKLHSRDLKPLITFSKKHNLKRGFIFYDGELNKISIDGVEIILLPLIA